MHPMLNIAVQAARQASKILLRFMDHLDSLEISLKARNDIVTEVDRLSEREIINVIRKVFPDHAILAEEGGFIQGNEFCWIIDPLDGTSNYVRGYPHFSISIAVKRNQVYEAGVVLDPIRHELFMAARGQGAQFNDHRIRVNTSRKLENSIIGTGFSRRDVSNLKPQLNIVNALLPQVGDIRRSGSPALDLAYVASGRLDGFWEASLKEWDIAAGALLVQEAGGVVGDFNGENQFAESGNIVAANSKIFKELLHIIENNQ